MTTFKITTDADTCEAMVNGKVYQMRLDTITETAKAYIWGYGFQRAINDRTGGKDKTPADKDDIARAMIANFADESWVPGTRAGSDPMEYYRAMIFAGILAAKEKADESWFGAKGGFKTDAVDPVIAILAKQAPKTVAKIESLAVAARDKAVAEAAARKAAKEALAAKAADAAEGMELNI